MEMIESGTLKARCMVQGTACRIQRENLKALLNLLILVPFAAIYWSLWNQNFSSWVAQAENMDRHLLGHEWLPSQIQTVNPDLRALLAAAVFLRDLSAGGTVLSGSRRCGNSARGCSPTRWPF